MFSFGLVSKFVRGGPFPPPHAPCSAPPGPHAQKCRVVLPPRCWSGWGRGTKHEVVITNWECNFTSVERVRMYFVIPQIICFTLTRCLAPGVPDEWSRLSFQSFSETKHAWNSVGGCPEEVGTPLCLGTQESLRAGAGEGQGVSSHSQWAGG